MNFFGLIIIMIVVIFIGMFIALIGIKFSLRMSERKLQKNLLKVLNGTRDNTINIDGKVTKVDRFILRDENNNEIIVDLKGGEIKKENAGKDKNTKEKRKNNSFGNLFNRRRNDST